MVLAPDLWLFFVVVLGTVLLPGLDMTYVLARSLAGGRRDGLLAVAGIIAGGVVHMIIGVLGVAIVLKTVPWAFNGLLLAGAAYISWIGLSLVLGANKIGPLQVAPATTQSSPWRIFFMGMATNLLNPKAYLFMLAVFPQFMDPARGSLWTQAASLWVIAALCQAAVYGGLALAAVATRQWLSNKPTASAWAFRIVGVLLIVFALITAVRGYQAII